MILNAAKSGSGNFIPHPVTPEPVRAVCVDLTVPKLVQTQFGPKMKFKAVFETETEKEGGEKFCVWSRPFTMSANEKSTFRQFLKQMFGEDVLITRAAPNGDVDPEALCLGFPVKLMIGHTEKDGEIYADITTIFPDKTSAPLRPTGKFVREKDRPEREGQHGGGASQTVKPAPSGDWKTTMIHMGSHKGKTLDALDAQQLPDFINSYLAWLGGRSTVSAQENALAAACRAAKLYLDNQEDDIPF